MDERNLNLHKFFQNDVVIAAGKKRDFLRLHDY